MNLQKCILTIIIFFVCLMFVSSNSLTVPPKLLLISFDGFRWDYLKLSQNLKHFQRMIDNGAWSENGLKNTFVTKTLPNHYTLVTGLYEESHGIVGNSMYDPLLNETFNPWNSSEEKDPRWFDNGGEPIWVTNQRQSTEHRSGVLFWPGDEASVEGFLPYRYMRYTETMPLRERIDIIIEWFTDKYPINLGLLYFIEPDKCGHKYGPKSAEMKEKIEELDEDLGYLFEKLNKHKLLADMNVILTSDHGMTETYQDDVHKIDLNKYINIDTYYITTSSPVAMLRPKTKELITEIYKNLSGIPHLHVYLKEDIPEEYHFKHNRRIQAIVLEPDEHFWVSYNNSKGTVGNHGYNNSLDSMHPVFIAMGPSFKPRSTVSIFNNVDVYPLMCDLLKLNPAPNNGSLDIVQHLLHSLHSTSVSGGTNTFGAYIFILLFIGLVSGIFSVAACQVHRQYKRRRFQLRSIPGMFPDHAGHTHTKADRAPLMSETSDEEFGMT